MTTRTARRKGRSTRQPVDKPGHAGARGRDSAGHMAITCECGWESGDTSKKTALRQYRGHLDKVPDMPTDLYPRTGL